MTVPLCIPMTVPLEHVVPAADLATRINPANTPSDEAVARLPMASPQPEHLALITGKKWKAGTVLPVYFLDGGPQPLRDKIIAVANTWHDGGVNISVAETKQAGDAVIRLARTPGLGYWSYIGTDVALYARQGQQTLNLDSFTLATDPREYERVVPHEFGHSFGFPHGQQTAEVLAMIDVEGIIHYYMRSQGWPYDQAAAQFAALGAEAEVWPGNVDSVMTYEVPPPYCKPGFAVPGGTHVTPADLSAALHFYPPSGGPGSPPGGEIFDWGVIV